MYFHFCWKLIHHCCVLILQFLTYYFFHYKKLHAEIWELQMLGKVIRFTMSWNLQITSSVLTYYHASIHYKILYDINMWELQRSHPEETENPFRHLVWRHNSKTQDMYWLVLFFLHIGDIAVVQRRSRHKGNAASEMLDRFKIDRFPKLHPSCQKSSYVIIKTGSQSLFKKYDQNSTLRKYFFKNNIL